MTPVKTPVQQVTALEEEWSRVLHDGCAPSPTPEAKKAMKAFLEKTLADNYTNTDHLGKKRTKKEDIDNCVMGRYKVDSLTIPPKMDVRDYGECVVVVGNDDVTATYEGKNVGGKFIWTDTWSKIGGEWKCVASHGSKL